MKLFKILIKPKPPNYITKTFNLELYVSLISNNSHNLHSVICSEIDTASITNKRLLQKNG